MTADRTCLTLVNLSDARSRTVIVQAGSMSQHRFGTVKVVGTEDAQRPVAVDGAHLRVVLPPRRQITLDLATRCFVSDPAYGLPISAGS